MRAFARHPIGYPVDNRRERAVSPIGKIAEYQLHVSTMAVCEGCQNHVVARWRVLVERPQTNSGCVSQIVHTRSGKAALGEGLFQPGCDPGHRIRHP